MYKDSDKQRERQRRYKAGQKALPIGLHGASVLGIDPIELADSVFDDKPKRGKDIKCFTDLPPDVQQTIGLMSRRDGKDRPNRESQPHSHCHSLPAHIPR